MSIIRYLAKKSNLYSNDHYKAAQIDEIGYVVGDLISGILAINLRSLNVFLKIVRFSTYRMVQIQI